MSTGRVQTALHLPDWCRIADFAVCKSTADLDAQNIYVQDIDMLNLKYVINHSSVKIDKQNIFFSVSLKK